MLKRQKEMSHPNRNALNRMTHGEWIFEFLFFSPIKSESLIWHEKGSKDNAPTICLLTAITSERTRHRNEIKSTIHPKILNGPTPAYSISQKINTNRPEVLALIKYVIKSG